MQFSTLTYNRLKQRLKRRYTNLLAKDLKKARNLAPNKTASWLKEHQSELKEFSPQKWYLLQQVNLLWFALEGPIENNSSDEFTEEDDAIFERWNRSEFADYFLKQLNRRIPLRKASQQTARVFDDHLVSMANLHILRIDKVSKNYRKQTSLGDIANPRGHSKMLETTLHLDGKELVLMTTTLREMKQFSQRIEIATKVIRHFSADSWERFKAFTEVIIPIKQDELVSYSHQELPGTSMINLYNRDFVDLLDDLLHENGHHHLNYYLNLGQLIHEPIDNIYYSPWRRTLRPIRGIFHAYFTFFWAFKLFSDLARAKELDSIFYIFSPKEKEKIFARAVEEYYMLDYSYQDLIWARKKGLIMDAGWELIKEQQTQLRGAKKKVLEWEKEVGSYRKELTKLKQTLKNARKIYHKN